MRKERLNKIKQVVERRQANITVVLNNVHDPHNIGAVLRTCDSVGIKDVYVLYDDTTIDKVNLRLGKNAAASSRKWVDVLFYMDVEKCFEDIKKKYDLILGTHLNSDSVSLYDLKLDSSIALVFGNERDGISEAVLPYLDGNFLIPQMGMVQSLNISVSVAVTMYEVLRQRNLKGLYENNTTSTPEQKEELLKDYINRHNEKYKGRMMKERL